jgi:hypothetical protein
MQVFIAGVMQGSRTDHLIDEQDYRQRIASALEKHVPDVEIVDPWRLNPDSVNYDIDKARETFKSFTAKAADADVLIAYLPTASMGTAIEMWTAFGASKRIVVVSPLVHNWVIYVTADEVLPDLDSLIAAIEDGRFAKLLTADG